MGIISVCAPTIRCGTTRIGTVGDYNIITEIRSAVLLQCTDSTRRVPLRRRRYSYVGTKVLGMGGNRTASRVP